MDCGCATDARSSRMPFSQQYASTSPSDKLLPLSVIMLCGRPNLTTRSQTNLRAVVPSSFLMGLASIHLVNLSTATSRCVNPHGVVCNGPTMSSPQTANGQVIGIVCNSSAGTCGCRAQYRHHMHVSTSLSASAFAVSQ